MCETTSIPLHILSFLAVFAMYYLKHTAESFLFHFNVYLIQEVGDMGCRRKELCQFFKLCKFM
jgi:hypothetical protein